MDINTKSRGCGCRLRLGVDGGADSRKTSFPPCRLRHPHRHAVHDDSRRDGIKSGHWPLKKSAVGGTKTAAYWEPLPSPPKGREFIPVVFEEVVVHSLPLGKAGMGLVGGYCCRPVGIAVGHYCASCCLRNSRTPRHVAHGDFAERDGHCRYLVDRPPDLRNHHGWLVTYDTWARAY